MGREIHVPDGYTGERTAHWCCINEILHIVSPRFSVCIIACVLFSTLSHGSAIVVLRHPRRTN